MATARLIGKLGGASWVASGVVAGFGSFVTLHTSPSGKITVCQLTGSISSSQYRLSTTGSTNYDVGRNTHHIILPAGVSVRGSAVTLDRYVEIDL